TPRAHRASLPMATANWANPKSSTATPSSRSPHASYESLVVKHICDPLQMNSTRVTLTPQLKSDLARGHSAAGPPVKYWGSDALVGDGALFSSANDMLKFLATSMGKTP